MLQTNTGFISIQQCLQDEVTAMATLAALLKKEQSALVEGDIALLTEYTINKGQLVGVISELEKKRHNCLSELGFKADADGMQAYLQQASIASVAAVTWNELLHLSEQAKEDNRTNGMLINRHLSQNQAALNVLQQNNPAGSLYGPNGQSTVKNAPRRGYVAG
ncbi:MAG: flagellar protein FlgN [Burkholderiales bacterium]|nr:flagellar protein FlgN [Burkholderiales bacterium]